MGTKIWQRSNMSSRDVNKLYYKFSTYTYYTVTLALFTMCMATGSRLPAAPYKGVHQPDKPLRHVAPIRSKILNRVLNALGWVA